MKKFLLFILVLVIIAGVCVVTCPDKAAHCKALKDVLNTVLTEELSSDESDADLVMFGSMIGTGLGGLVIDNMLKVDNYLFAVLVPSHTMARPKLFLSVC